MAARGFIPRTQRYPSRDGRSNRSPVVHPREQPNSRLASRLVFSVGREGWTHFRWHRDRFKFETIRVQYCIAVSLSQHRSKYFTDRELGRPKRGRLGSPTHRASSLFTTVRDLWFLGLQNAWRHDEPLAVRAVIDLARSKEPERANLSR